MEESINIDKGYRSEKVGDQPSFIYDKNNKKRPSWIKVSLDKNIIFIKILFNDEAFWYKRYFDDYFLPFEATSDDMKNFYNETAEKYESFIPHQKEVAKRLVLFLREHGIKKDSKILDLGAGTGMVTEEIAKEGYKNLTLLDISDKELEVAKNKASLKNASFIAADLMKDEIKGKYDVIVETLAFNEILERNILTILKNIKESLNEGGFFIMIDRHLSLKLNSFFKEIKKGKFSLETSGGKFDFYYFVGEKISD